MSSNKPLKLASLSVPWAEASIFLKIASRVSLRLSSPSALSFKFSKSSLGNIKKPLVFTRSSLADSESSSDNLA